MPEKELQMLIAELEMARDILRDLTTLSPSEVDQHGGPRSVQIKIESITAYIRSLEDKLDKLTADAGVAIDPATEEKDKEPMDALIPASEYITKAHSLISIIENKVDAIRYKVIGECVDRHLDAEAEKRISMYEDTKDLVERLSSLEAALSTINTYL